MPKEQWSAEQDIGGAFEIYNGRGKFVGYAYNEVEVLTRVKKYKRRMGEPPKGVKVDFILSTGSVLERST